MQVIAGHVERLRVFGSPEADEGPGDVVELELRLNRGRLHERHPFLGTAHRPGVDVVEMPVHAEGEEHVVGMP